MHKALTANADRTIALHMIDSDMWDNGKAGLDKIKLNFAEAVNFKAGAGQIVLCPNGDGDLTDVIFGLGDGTDRLAVSALAAKLPAGDYEVSLKPDAWSFEAIVDGWIDGAYRFQRYLSSEYEAPRLIVPETADAAALTRLADAVDRVRDLVNTPAGDMGPDAIEAAVRALATSYSAKVSTVTGDDLISENYPMVHAVGRAADIPPRIVELSWGNPKDPELAVIGKGVSFDTGGLNIKTGGYMRIMKKDMGGSAHAIALAGLVMDAGLPVHLKLYVPTVENAISGNAFRPGDVLQSRKGKTVEIDNTDAEGRLILADALARACEGEPDLIIDFATLTGAARVALGPDLAPYYTDDESLAAALADAAEASGDPAWRMPLWSPYLGMLKSSVADIVNSGGGGMAGSITAALFLREFVDTERWVHLDVWAWREAKYGRPAGAAACGLRAVWHMIQHRYAN
ncbi:MAG: leucyl aminopeptidase family protein [Pseudomonadota bacterium]